MKCKHQWDYLRTGRFGPEDIAADRTEYAIWMCPLCERILKLETNLDLNNKGGKNGK